MRLDLLAGTASRPRLMPSTVPTILVFDSGLGGLTVLAEAAKARPDARFVYAADDAAFPYGRFDEEALGTRILAVMERLVETYAPDLVVIACNTASTVGTVLPRLRARFDMPFVGTVPAIKPAAAMSRTKRIAVLATPGTVARGYTKDLVAAYAGDCRVTLVGSTRLAGLAERELRGDPAADAEILAEIAPCFVDEEGARTDVVVLACTHYPLLLTRYERLAPWPVHWLDPAPAIARRMTDLLGPALIGEARGPEAIALFTDGSAATPALREALFARGLRRIAVEPMPLG